MTVQIPRARTLIEDALLILDREYRVEYVSPSGTVSKPRMYREHLPQHPRRCSAARRHRHQRQLPYRIGQLVPGAATILLTPVWTDINANETGHLDISFMARVRDRNGRPMKLPAGGSQRLAALLQGAFTADWGKSQTWRADTNQLVGR